MLVTVRRLCAHIAPSRHELLAAHANALHQRPHLLQSTPYCPLVKPHLLCCEQVPIACISTQCWCRFVIAIAVAVIAVVVIAVVAVTAIIAVAAVTAVVVLAWRPQVPSVVARPLLVRVWVQQ